ncbi:unnamed protein product [Mytilus coruscus]|uniref:ANK n=1 Tax=Mytilus coruscus TaxID=42192 RepID=A0A6J8EQL2_MYTCO|nr:unnamed protein product [Mytilus coruscus]
MHNVFGASTFEQNKAMKWLEMSKDIKIMLESNRVKLLASCKTHIFQHRIVKKIDVFSETSCDFLASNYCLTDDERLNIANLYLTKDEIRLLKSSNAWSQFCFFPLLCQCYSRQKSCNVVDYFKYPIESVSADLSSMESFDQTALATLFLFVVYNNCIKESSLMEETKIKPILKVISRNFDLKSQLSIQVVKNEIEQLKNSYIEKRNTEYTIMHDMIFDIFVLFCGEHMFDLLIDVAHTEVIRDRFALKRLPRDKDMHELVVEITLEKEDKYFERLKKDMEQGFIQNVFSNRNLKDFSFRLNFKKMIANDMVVSLPDKVVFSLLMLMMDRGFCDIVSVLLAKTINLNQIYWDGETPLFKAANKGYTEVVTLLLKQKANPNLHACFNWLNHIDNVYPGITVNSLCDNSKTPSRYSPPPLPSYKIIDIPGYLMRNNSDYVISKHNIIDQSVKSYLKHLSSKGSKMYEQYKVYKISPLHVAASKGYTDIVELLLSYNAEQNYVTKCHQIASPLFTASSKGFIDIVRFLLKYLSKVNVIVPERQMFNMIEYSFTSLDISLYIAVEKGYYDIVELLLSHKNNFDRSQRYLYWNMVTIAIVNGHDNIVTLLLEQKFHSNGLGDATPLFKCICEGKTEIVKLLLEHDFDPNICNRNESPLYRATYLGHIEIVKLLLQYDSEPNGDERYVKSPLYIASCKGHTEIVKLLLKQNYYNHIDEQFALHVATHEGHTEIVELLLKHETAPDVFDINRKQLLLIASERGHTEIVKLLLGHNCDRSVCNKNNESPMIAASKNSHTETVKLLLDYNCDPSVCNTDNESPMIAASKNGHTETVKLLLDYNCDPSVCNTDNESPLFAASKNGHTETVKLLVDHNCDPSVCNKDNESPLFMASKNGHTKTVKLLLAHNCDPSICNTDNESPLFVASKNGHTETVKLLLDHNCDPSVCNKDNESPLFLASKNGYAKTVKLLLDYKCDPSDNE